MSDAEKTTSEPTPVPVEVDSGAAAQTINQIPGYQLIEKLGAGAMAVVFKARQISLDRIVAIKILPKRLSEDEEYLQRFMAEGHAAAKLNHPNIVQAIDVGQANGYHYFVMEYVEGKTVYDELQTGKVYTEAEALNIVLQVANALKHAHGMGLIHRDVKPKNIMLAPDGTAKLMDMGLARAATDAEAIQAEAGRLFGTPYYISPEQIIGRKDVDFRCDIYSLGATLYHMVTGQPPFEGEDAKAVMIKHCKEKLVSPDRHNLELSFGLCKLITKMMGKRRRDRHQSTEALIEDLQSIDFLLDVESPGSGLAAVTTQPAKPSAPAPSSTGLSTPVAPKADPVAKKNPVNAGLLVGLIVSVLVNIALALMLIL